ncbi:MAG: DUF3768 domain-containing protein [Syntrophobacteraceae bacterium]|jgi:hypothetical protein
MTPQLATPGNDEAARIRVLNDNFRSTGAGGKVFMTRGIAALPYEDQFEILRQVRAFDVFTEANDPHHEHDFGAFMHSGHKVFWKIDYYDPSMTFGSEDPADTQKTSRVLTIMLAEEY